MSFKEFFSNMFGNDPVIIRPSIPTGEIPMAFGWPGSLPDLPSRLDRYLHPDDISRLTKAQKKKVYLRLNVLKRDAEDMYKIGNYPKWIASLPTECVKASCLVALLCRQRGYPVRLGSGVVTGRHPLSGGNAPARHMWPISCGYSLDILTNNVDIQGMSAYNVPIYQISDYDLRVWYWVEQHPKLNKQFMSRKRYLKFVNANFMR